MPVFGFFDRNLLRLANRGSPLAAQGSGSQAHKIASPILSYSEKLWNAFEILLEHCKKYFERKNLQTRFSCFNLPTVKIWGQLDKFPLSFSSLQCALQVKK